jgi:hypothetical protein
MIGNWLFHPFKYIAGSKALILGLLVSFLTVIISHLGYVHFDGVLDIHLSSYHVSIYHLAVEQLTNLLSITVVFWLAGYFFSKSSTRVIDVAGTMLLARWPLMLCAIASINTKAKSAAEYLSLKFTTAEILFMLLCICSTIWMMVLTYNAYSISCNIKAPKKVPVFIVGILLAEIISKLALSMANSLF